MATRAAPPASRLTSPDRAFLSFSVPSVWFLARSRSFYLTHRWTREGTTLVTRLKRERTYVSYLEIRTYPNTVGTESGRLSGEVYLANWHRRKERGRASAAIHRYQAPISVLHTWNYASNKYSNKKLFHTKVVRF